MTIMQLMEECSSTSASASQEVCLVAYPSAAVAITDKGRYVQDKQRCQVHKIIIGLCPRVVNDILSEDMLCKDDFMAVAFPVAEAFLICLGLCNSYTTRQQRPKKTKLQEAIDQVEQKRKACVETLQQIGSIKLSLSIGLAQLSRATLEKKLLVTRVCEQLILLKNAVTDRKLLSDIRR